MSRNRGRLGDCGSTLLKYFYFVSICKYLLTAGLREQAFNVTQLWPSIMKFSHSLDRIILLESIYSSVFNVLS